MVSHPIRNCEHPIFIENTALCTCYVTGFGNFCNLGESNERLDSRFLVVGVWGSRAPFVTGNGEDAANSIPARGLTGLLSDEDEAYSVSSRFNTGVTKFIVISSSSISSALSLAVGGECISTFVLFGAGDGLAARRCKRNLDLVSASSGPLILTLIPLQVGHLSKLHTV